MVWKCDVIDGKDGRSMFILNTEMLAIITKVKILGGVLRSKNREVLIIRFDIKKWLVQEPYIEQNAICTC